MVNVNNAAALSKLDEAELDSLIGEYQLADAAGSKFATLGEKIEIGQAYFEDLLPDIRAKVCKSEVISMLFSSKHKERNEIAISIVGGLLYGAAVPPLLLAAKAISYGLDRLCPANES